MGNTMKCWSVGALEYWEMMKVYRSILHHSKTPLLRFFSSRLQHLNKRFLRDVHLADDLHAFLAFLLLLEQLALARDIATVAFRRHILPHGLHVFASDDLAADGRLDCHLIHLRRDYFLQFLGQETTA